MGQSVSQPHPFPATLEDPQEAVKMTARSPPKAEDVMDLLDDNERDELKLFLTQEQFRLEDNARKDAYNLTKLQLEADYKAKKDNLKLEFHKANKEAHEDRVCPLAHRLFYRKIDATRERTIPAYTFTRFLKLPTELQHRIWSMAARFEEPQLRCILGIGQDVGFCTEPEARMLQSLVLSNHKVIPQNYGSSRILVPYAEIRARQRERRKAPVLFRVSRDSRAIAKTVYSLQPYNDNPNRKLRFTGRLKDGAAFMSRKMLYVNTLYDQFYLGNAESMWKQYKVHVDLLLKLNFRSVNNNVDRDLSGLLTIRHLSVHLDIFQTAPIHIWKEFKKLQDFIIVMEHDGFESDNADPAQADFIPEFLTPGPDTIYYKRANWLKSTATEALLKGNPGWRIPSIDVVVRATDEDDLDMEVRGTVADSDHKSVAEEDEPLDVDDSEWYAKVGLKMKHEVSQQEIEELGKLYLRTSERVTTTQAIFNCRDCNLTFPSNSQLHKHIRASHFDVDNPVTTQIP